MKRQGTMMRPVEQRKRSCRLSLVLLVSTIILAQSASADGVLRVHPTNPRYFTDNSGKAVYLAGVDNFRALQDWNRFGVGTLNFGSLLDYLQSNQHNYLRLWSWEHHYSTGPEGPYNILPPHIFKRTGPGAARDGLAKFKLSEFDQAYFDRLRQRIVEAGQHGVYVNILLFQSFSLGSTEWVGHPFNAANNISGVNGDSDADGEGYETHTLHNTGITALQEAYVKKVIDTVNDLDNVLYEIANESFAETGKINSHSAVVSWQHHIINLIHNYEKTKSKRHPVGMTMLRSSGSDNSYLFQSPADWISPGGRWVEPAWQNNPPIADGRKIVIADTDHIHPDQPGGVGNQPWLWMCLTRGHNVNAVDGDGVSEDWFSPDDSRVMRDTSRYASRINLASMLPTANASECSTTFCLRNPGWEYLVYQPGSGSFAVNLLAGSYSFEWFNPVSGTVYTTGSLTVATGSRNFAPPFSGRAVLYLKSLNPSPPSSLKVR